MMQQKLIRFGFVSLMGFISGLPLMLVGSTLQAWGTSQGLNLMALGFLTLVGQPYAYKFLWSPLLDRYRLKPWLGLRRSWIITMSLMLAASLFLLSLSELPEHLYWFIAFATITALASATMDIAIDAYRIEYLNKDEYALGNACYVSAYRIAMLVSGGLALIIADKIGWRTTYQCMAALTIICSIVMYFAPEPAQSHEPREVKWLASIVNPVKDLLTRKEIWFIFGFTILYKLGEALGTALTSTFLLRGLGFSLTEVGAVYKTVGLIATIAGAFLGGALYKYFRMYKSLMYFGVLQALGLLFYVMLAKDGQHNIPLMIIAVGSEAFTAGMSTTVFVAYLMSLCNTEYTATQFALLSTLPALGRVFTGPLASSLVMHFNWTGYFLISFFVCVPGLIALRLLKRYIAE